MYYDIFQKTFNSSGKFRIAAVAPSVTCERLQMAAGQQRLL